MSERRYIPVVLPDGSAAMLQFWSSEGKVRFALVTQGGHIEFATEPEFAGGLANHMLLCETDARLQRKPRDAECSVCGRELRRTGPRECAPCPLHPGDPPRMHFMFANGRAP